MKPYVKLYEAYDTVFDGMYEFTAPHNLWLSPPSIFKYWTNLLKAGIVHDTPSGTIPGVYTSNALESIDLGMLRQLPYDPFVLKPTAYDLWKVFNPESTSSIPRTEKGVLHVKHGNSSVGGSDVCLSQPDGYVDLARFDGTTSRIRFYDIGSPIGRIDETGTFSSLGHTGRYAYSYADLTEWLVANVNVYKVFVHGGGHRIETLIEGLNTYESSTGAQVLEYTASVVHRSKDRPTTNWRLHRWAGRLTLPVSSPTPAYAQRLGRYEEKLLHVSFGSTWYLGIPQRYQPYNPFPVGTYVPKLIFVSSGYATARAHPSFSLPPLGDRKVVFSRNTFTVRSEMQEKLLSWYNSNFHDLLRGLLFSQHNALDRYRNTVGANLLETLPEIGSVIPTDLLIDLGKMISNWRSNRHFKLIPPHVERAMSNPRRAKAFAKRHSWRDLPTTVKLANGTRLTRKEDIIRHLTGVDDSFNLREAVQFTSRYKLQPELILVDLLDLGTRARLAWSYGISPTLKEFAAFLDYEGIDESVDLETTLRGSYTDRLPYEDRHVHVRFQSKLVFDVPPIESGSILGLLDKVGVLPTPSRVWATLPFSFLIDQVAATGSWLEIFESHFFLNGFPLRYAIHSIRVLDVKDGIETTVYHRFPVRTMINLFHCGSGMPELGPDRPPIDWVTLGSLAYQLLT